MTLGQDFKKERVEIRLMRSHLARNVERNTLVLAPLGRTNALVVERLVTKWEIVLMLRGKRRVDSQWF